MYVFAAATLCEYGDPVLVDETLAPLDPKTVQPGDVVGIRIHTAQPIRAATPERQSVQKLVSKSRGSIPQEVPTVLRIALCEQREDAAAT